MAGYCTNEGQFYHNEGTFVGYESKEPMIAYHLHATIKKDVRRNTNYHSQKRRKTRGSRNLVRWVGGLG
ncbi:hypothetical protein PanWU01x14_259530 [Parasponia andersonii]|uniref:Uncharacterized protein n=1 Tax=Parasponia andersonii TaxID=3476 RepID=A0A2P5B959_PARAD|nr:hypothetical protein PanWU01x14_259530 [Parasponia andersonii]